MDLLTQLSAERPDMEEDEPLLGGCTLVESRSYKDDKLLSQMHRLIHQTPPAEARAPLCEEEDTGDTFLEMILQPSVRDDQEGRNKENQAKEV